MSRALIRQVFLAAPLSCAWVQSSVSLPPRLSKLGLPYRWSLSWGDTEVAIMLLAATWRFSTRLERPKEGKPQWAYNSVRADLIREPPGRGVTQALCPRRAPEFFQSAKTRPPIWGQHLRARTAHSPEQWGSDHFREGRPYFLCSVWSLQIKLSKTNRREHVHILFHVNIFI